MDRRAAWVLGIIFGGLFLCLFAFLMLFWAAIHVGNESGSGADAVGVVEIKGPIKGARSTLDALRAFRKNPRVKALVIRIDSPGGAVAPSQEIYEAIRKLRDRKKVVASMGTVAASGAFYIACAADKIYADPGTLTGSIGVIMQAPNIQGLMKWAGVQMNTLTAGKMKDALSPYRELRPDERTYFQNLLEDVHEQFIGAVAAGRGLKIEDVRRIADGRVFTGRQAKKLRLVDELGGLNDAVAAAGKMAGIEGEPAVIYPKHHRPFLQRLIGRSARSVFHGVAEAASEQMGVGIEYRLPLGGQ